MNTKIFAAVALLMVSVLVACSSQLTGDSRTVIVGDAETTIYFNADVVTVNDAAPSATAVAVRDGFIIAVGSKEEVEATVGANPVYRDLQGKTMVPGLIDAHGHLSLTAMTRGFANVQPPPAGPVESISQLQAVMKSWLRDHPAMPWVLGWGYDDSLLAEQRHPTRDDLDAISTDIAIALMHVSGHLMACNSKCLELVGISERTPNPPGGLIRRIGDTQTPNGILEESAIFSVYSQLPASPVELRMQMLSAAQQYYASYGLTTLQDGAAQVGNIKDLQMAAERQNLYLDVVAFQLLRKGQNIGEDFSVSSQYQNHFRSGGIKLVLDGSPQGKTAWLTKPYIHPPHGQNDDYKGYPALEDTEVNSFIKEAFERNIPVLAHANGDAAADQLVRAVTLANRDLGAGDRRTVMIHAQTAREDQIDQMQLQGIIPSYFVAHTFYWGDWHRDSVFGEERASRISPLRSTQLRDIPYTIHNDTPIVPPDMMRLMWAAVNRMTRSGKVLGEAQRVSPLQALKSITINAAHQLFEEDRKGSIEVGKLADLVILSENPLKVEPSTIKDIKIEETIKEGVAVFNRTDGG